MKHSILIPHRNRNKHLEWTLWSIERSAQVVGIYDYEVIVLDSHSNTRPMPEHCFTDRVVAVGCPMSVFNKPKLYNLGIALAHGDVLTFLDADILVGERWMEGVNVLEDSSIIRLCYRVRNLPEEWSSRLAGDPCEAVADAAFARWDEWPQTMECYGFHNRNKPDYDKQPWGNSQFSVTRENLGDLRYDERYEGKGREDLEFNRQFERRYGENYRGFIRHEPDYSLLHMYHEHDNLEEWSDPKYSQRHIEMYESE